LSNKIFKLRRKILAGNRKKTRTKRHNLEKERKRGREEERKRGRVEERKRGRGEERKREGEEEEKRGRVEERKRGIESGWGGNRREATQLQRSEEPKHDIICLRRMGTLHASE
jgi:hypothetical protein